jgi:hypothetical protein
VKVILVLPSQESVYSNLYEVLADLTAGLSLLSIESKIVEVTFGDSAAYPFGNVDHITKSQLSQFFDSVAGSNKVLVTVDDHKMVKWLYKNKKVENMVIWAHYFYGSRYIFQLYRNSNEVFPIKYTSRLRSLFAAMVPNTIAIRASSFYWKTLHRYPVFSQSLWTGLLLERVFSISVSGKVLIPVDQRLYNFPEPEKREGVLVFLGSAGETDLASLNYALNTLDSSLLARLDYFGNEEAERIFENIYGIKMNFIGKVTRKDLLRSYSEHMITISPIFNGNFEMVPIQSLLCGTPVISFSQPFLEVIGENNMTANIRNLGEIKYKVKQWMDLDQQARISMKHTIFEKMESRKVAKDLLQYLQTLGFS